LNNEGRRFGTVYETYTKSRFWWEPLALLRRTALIVVTVSTSDPIYLAEGFLFTTSLMLMLQVWFKPYFLHWDNFLEQFSLFFLSLVAILETSVLNKTTPTAATQFFLTIFIIGPIFVMAVYILYLQYQGVKALFPQMKRGAKVEEPGVVNTGLLPNEVRPISSTVAFDVEMQNLDNSSPQVQNLAVPDNNNDIRRITSGSVGDQRMDDIRVNPTQEGVLDERLPEEHEDSVNVN